MLQADHASLLGHWLVLASPLAPVPPGGSAMAASGAVGAGVSAADFGGSMCETERATLALEFAEAFRVLWFAHMAQLLMRAGRTVSEGMWDENGDLDGGEALHNGDGPVIREMFEAVWKCLPGEVRWHGAGRERVLNLAVASSLPFLRRAMLLRAVVLGTPLPAPRATVSAAEQAVYLLPLLGLPRAFPGRVEESLQLLLRKWVDLLPNAGAAVACGVSLLPLEGPRLVGWQAPGIARLPQHFHELLRDACMQECPRCRTVPKEPALCLLCGCLVCGPSSTAAACCADALQRGECSQHAIKCGAGVAPFIFVKQCLVLLLRASTEASSKGAVKVGAAGARLPTPYLDVFGEEDEYLRRGKPLSLCEARHQRLLWLWVTHKLREEIARAGQNRPDNNWSIF